MTPELNEVTVLWDPERPFPDLFLTLDLFNVLFLVSFPTRSSLRTKSVSSKCGSRAQQRNEAGGRKPSGETATCYTDRDVRMCLFFLFLFSIFSLMWILLFLPIFKNQFIFKMGPIVSYRALIKELTA